MPAARRFPMVILTIAAIAAAGYGGALALLYAFQERVIFPGTPLPANHRFVFGTQAFEEIRVSVEGGTLDALHFTQPDPNGLVFFVHGNAGNLETWTSGIEFYRRVNWDLFIFDYRGYGRSTGRIESEAQLHADVRAAWDAIAPRYAGRPIVIYGRSLGTALATQLAREVDPALLVLVTPYTSLAAIGRRAYPWAPEALLKYPLRTDAVIGEVRSPIVLIHGTRDELVPFAESEALRKLARAPVDMLVVEGGAHNDLQTFPSYIEGLAARLAVAAGPSAGRRIALP